MKTLDIDLGARSYQVRIGRGLLSSADEIVPWVAGAQACVVTDQTVAPLYLDTLRATLAAHSHSAKQTQVQVVAHILPCGEPHKNLAEVERIFECLLRARCDREATVIALGGGVVGDMAGFAAACYQRGVPFIQIPTTLLAQVDSAVGGKTGVNHALGKNMIGAFHQPRRVVVDIATLDTLPRRQFAAGMAEVIKVGLIHDAEFFMWLERNMQSAMARAPAALEFLIQRSCHNKARIIEQDERERELGARALLNLGHTFAHAIETGAGYGKWLHGEAVATGLAMAAYMSAQLGWISKREQQRIERLLTAAELPIAPFGGLSAARMLEIMRVDKKARHGNLRLVLLKGIGNAEMVADYPAQVLQDTLTHFTG